jgi:hypothetical protein
LLVLAAGLLVFLLLLSQGLSQTQVLHLATAAHRVFKLVAVGYYKPGVGLLDHKAGQAVRL